MSLIVTRQPRLPFCIYFRIDHNFQAHDIQNIINKLKIFIFPLFFSSKAIFDIFLIHVYLLVFY